MFVKIKSAFRFCGQKPNMRLHVYTGREQMLLSDANKVNWGHAAAFSVWNEYSGRNYINYLLLIHIKSELFNVKRATYF